MDAGPEGIGTGPAAESAGQGRGMASPACSCGCRCASAGPGEPGLVEVVQGWTRALAGAEVSEIDDAGLLALVEGLEVLGGSGGGLGAGAGRLRCFPGGRPGPGRGPRLQAREGGG
ncbi:hypothetical protein [Ornithinimicrobium sp. W1665]|uniref:hypothetical protein n=1 Tax=Ornithinimicrobium sp. W1665 TaxID=3416666 RepID=UPI003D6A240B